MTDAGTEVPLYPYRACLNFNICTQVQWCSPQGQALALKPIFMALALGPALTIFCITYKRKKDNKINKKYVLSNSESDQCNFYFYFWSRDVHPV